MTTDTTPRNEYRMYRQCQECGWTTRVDREYHPYVACLIVKATGRDPLPYLRQVAEDIPTLNAKGQFPMAEPETRA